MGRHYFDRPPPTYAQPGQRPVALGEHRDLAGNPRPTADYANYYGTWAWERIFAAEDQAGVRHQGAAPRVVAAMAGLGLKEDLIEMEGLDVGRNKVRRTYYDSATSRSEENTSELQSLMRIPYAFFTLQKKTNN